MYRLRLVAVFIHIYTCNVYPKILCELIHHVILYNMYLVIVREIKYGYS